MKIGARDLIVCSISSFLVLIGAWYIVHSITDAKDVPGTWLPEGAERFSSLYQDADYGLAVATAGSVMLTYYLVAKEEPLWKVKSSKRSRRRRSAIIIAFGLGMAMLAIGGAAIRLHEAYTMPSDTIDHELKTDRGVEVARIMMVIGLIGMGVLLYGILFSKEPELEFTDNESILFNRPVWQGLSVVAMGIAIAVATWLYGTYKYRTYVERMEESRLTLIVMAGLLTTFVSVVVGLAMIARSSLMIRYRGELHPHESYREDKD